ncbi:MAG: response regulator [Bdellovibrionales bacterium]|nr:response regulator [Bdellovibrionales bacterium]
MPLDSSQLKNAKILIVDDNKINIDVLISALEPEGPFLSVAHSGEQAIELAQKIIPDIILLDVMMPGIDGFETCKRIKAIQTLEKVPVIFITAKNESDDIVKGFESGGIDYIQKPFDFSEVIARVYTHYLNYTLQRQIVFARDEALKAHQELSSAQEEILEAERIKSLTKSITNFAHEIDNPCNFVMNNIQGAKKSASSIESILNQVLSEDEEGQRLKNLLDPHFKKLYELVELSQIGARRIIKTVKELRDLSADGKGYLQPHDIGVILKKSVEVIESKFLKISYVKSTDPPLVYADGRRLVRALEHILLFSLRSAQVQQSHPEVQIQIDFSEKEVFIIVSDNGLVLSKQEYASLFEPLYYSKKLDKHSRIGLSLAYNIISKHKGTIKAKAENNKNTIQITIPVFSEENVA